MRSAEENNLEKDIKRWFSKLQKRVQKLIDTYYEDELFFLHVNKVYTIVEDMKPEYNAILLKHGLNVFYNAREVATTLYTIQQKKVSSKASLYEPKIIRQEDIGLFRTNPQIEDSLRYNTFQASDRTLARVTDNITNNLADSYHEGIGIKDAGRRINKEFTSLKGWESKRIARTEINSAQNVGSFSTYDELGVEYHMWWTGLDERVRDSHEDLHGHIVAVGNTFSNGLLYPGDKSGRIKEWINCRCTSIPYIIPLGMMAPLGMSEFTEADLIPIPGYTPITVEDALNGDYPLDYYTEGGIISQYRNKVKLAERNAMLYGVPIKESLIKNQFAVVTEDLSDFGITEKGLKTIQRIQKRNFGESKEFGFRFDEKKGKLLSKEYEGDGKSVDIPPSKREYSSIHNHTGDGLNPPSAEDFYNYFIHDKENIAINFSRDETWLIKSDKFDSKKINKICQKVYAIEVKQIQKLTKEYKLLKEELKEGKITQSELNEYLANEFVNKHNKELGDNLLKELSNVEGLNVRRVFNDTSVKPEFIEDLKNIETVKPKRNKRYVRKSPQIKGYDKYALTEAEIKEYERLKALSEKEPLKYHDRKNFNSLVDRKEFNELRNKILLEGGDPNDVFALFGAEGVRYEKLFKQFKDWVPKGKIEIKPVDINKKSLFKNNESFKLNHHEKTVLKELGSNRSILSADEKEYFFELSDKNTLNNLHEKLIREGLDEIDSRVYIDLYAKNKKKWDLPNLPLNLKFSTKKKYYSREQLYKEATEFKLTKKESDELYKLEKKEFMGQNLSSEELKKKKILLAQDEFAYLNALNINYGGLSYENYSTFKKLYNQLKTKLKLDKDILNQPLTNYKSDIPLDKNPKNLKKFKGTSDDGLLPNGEKITDYFTKDARDMTIREQQVVHRWLGSDYKAFTNFEVDCGRDVKKFEKWIFDMAKAYEKDNSLLYYKYYYKACRNNLTGRLNKSLAKDLARSIAHDVPVLDDILNNQIKQGLTLWRVQENHNLVSTIVGEIMEFPNFRSAAISKEGALWFSATNSKPMKYLIEIEAPTGTKGAFLAPIKRGTWFAPPEVGVEHPLHGQNYAREMEFLLKECKVELVKFGGKPVKGAMGEDLIPIKLRVVGYK